MITFPVQAQRSIPVVPGRAEGRLATALKVAASRARLSGMDELVSGRFQIPDLTLCPYGRHPEKFGSTRRQSLTSSVLLKHWSDNLQNCLTRQLP